MSYPAKAIANFFINKAKAEQDTLNLMKLLKLIYMAHGWSLALLDKPLIDEVIEAWKYGPVIANVYHALKHNALRNIDTPIEDYIYLDNGVVRKQAYDMPFDNSTKQLLEKVWNTYRQNTGIQLSNWSHKEDGPWFKVWHKHANEINKYNGIGIPDTMIKQYFTQLGRKNVGKCT